MRSQCLLGGVNNRFGPASRHDFKFSVESEEPLWCSSRFLLTPQNDERDGYVPNVVYSCGSMRANSRLVIPYGISDHAIGIATVDLNELLERLTQ